MSEGGRESLAGYLYQVLGAVGISARAFGGYDDHGGVMCELILKARSAKILHEVHDQDLLLQKPGPAGDTVTAVQFKHSRNPSLHPLHMNEVRDIVHAFDRCRRQLPPKTLIESYILVSNRPMALDTRILYNQRDPTKPFSSLASKATKWLLTTGKLSAVIKAEYGDTAAAAASWYDIFLKLVIVDNAPQVRWLDGLRRYARERGVSNEEFPASVERLVGAAINATAIGEIEFTQEWLNQRLFEVPDARNLVINSPGDTARSAAAEETRQLLRYTFALDESLLVPRSLLDEISRKAQQFPIVVLLGEGGCGKSVLAVQYLLENADRRFVCARSVAALSPGWIGQAFSSWRSLRHNHNLPGYPLYEVARRLLLANPNANLPLLVIALDGLDEASAGERAESQLFLRSPFLLNANANTIACILTSRSDGSDPATALHRILRKWFQTDVVSAVDHVGLVQVGPFGDDELMEAARYLEEPLSRRIRRAIRGLAGDDRLSAVELVDEDLGGTSAMTLDSSLIRSLHHPVVWGEFSRLRQPRQVEVLDGQKVGLDALAVALLERFYFKVSRRKEHLSPDRIRRAFEAIGRAIPINGRGSRDEHWIVPARGALPDDQALALFDEAISYGLISEDDAGMWTWRHVFVGAYLRSA